MIKATLVNGVFRVMSERHGQLPDRRSPQPPGISLQQEEASSPLNKNNNKTPELIHAARRLAGSKLNKLHATPSFYTTLAFQFPPHHRRTRSPPHSSYSAFVTPTRENSSVCANAAMPRHASNDGSAARTIRSGISGGRIGRNAACRRSERPGIRAGVPVKNTFWHGVDWRA